jgi:hypothetical protein
LRFSAKAQLQTIDIIFISLGLSMVQIDGVAELKYEMKKWGI